MKVIDFFKNNWIPILIYLVSLFVRLYSLGDTSVYPDEITWMVRGKEYIYAIKSLNFSYLTSGWWNNNHDTMAIGLPLVTISGLFHIFFAGTGKYSLNIFSDIVASRIPNIIVNSFTPVLIYSISKKLRIKLPWLPAILYSLNPITIGIDRWIIHDGILTTFFTASLFFFIKSFLEHKQSVLPGIFLGLAFISKPIGIILLFPWLAVLLVKRDNFWLKYFLINLFTTILAITLLWPQSWVRPIISIPEYILHQRELIDIGDPIRNYYFGIATDNPNPTYYLFQIFARTPEIILLLFMLSLWNWKAFLRSKNKILYLAIATTLISFMLIVSFAKKKGGIRYIDPLIPWIYIISVFNLERLSNKNLITNFISGILILLSVVRLFEFFPNYYLYYNQFVGGPSGAQKYDMVSLCFGAKEAIKYIEGEKIVGSIGIVGCSDTGPYYTARELTKDWQNATILIVETAFFQSQPKNPIFNSLANRKKIKEIYENKALTAVIYR